MSLDHPRGGVGDIPLGRMTKVFVGRAGEDRFLGPEQRSRQGIGRRAGWRFAPRVRIDLPLPLRAGAQAQATLHQHPTAQQIPQSGMA